MIIPVIIEPAYKDSHWCQRMIQGILDEAKRKKYTVHFFSSYEEEVPPFFAKNKGPRLIIIAGTSISWIPACVESLEKQNIRAILINYDLFTPYANHSVVRMDYVKAMQHLISYLKGCGRRHIACFGLNPNSSSDRIKESCFVAAESSQGSGDPRTHVFYNRADIKECFEQFLPRASTYDAMICANDIVAVSVLKMLQSSGIRVPDDLFLAGFGESVLSSKVTPSLTTISLDHEKLGHQAVLLYTYLSRQSMQITASIRVESTLVVRGSTGNMPYIPSQASFSAADPPGNINFYKDPETRRILDIEDFYKHSDDLDRQILLYMQKNETQERIAELCSTSVSTIHYRVKNMQNRLGLSSRRELLNWIKEQL